MCLHVLRKRMSHARHGREISWQADQYGSYNFLRNVRWSSTNYTPLHLVRQNFPNIAPLLKQYRVRFSLFLVSLVNHSSGTLNIRGDTSVHMWLLIQDGNNIRRSAPTYYNRNNVDAMCCNLSKNNRLCGLVVRAPGCRTEMYCASCEVRTEFIYVM
jgi:hypothetical protein